MEEITQAEVEAHQALLELAPPLGDMMSGPPNLEMIDTLKACQVLLEHHPENTSAIMLIMYKVGLHHGIQQLAEQLEHGSGMDFDQLVDLAYQEHIGKYAQLDDDVWGWLDQLPY